MNKKTCDVFEKLPDSKMLFQKAQKCPYFISLVILLEKTLTVAMICYWMILFFYHQKYGDFV